jgi:hypothetical protein
VRLGRWPGSQTEPSEDYANRIQARLKKNLMHTPRTLSGVETVAEKFNSARRGKLYLHSIGHFLYDLKTSKHGQEPVGPKEDLQKRHRTAKHAGKYEVAGWDMASGACGLFKPFERSGCTEKTRRCNTAPSLRDPHFDPFRTRG